MEQFLIRHKEYKLLEIITDICALLNSGGGCIEIRGKNGTNDKKTKELIKLLRKWLHNHLPIFFLDSYRISCDGIDLSKYVKIRTYTKNKKEEFTRIKVKPFKQNDGVVIFSEDQCIYGFVEGDKIRVVLNEFNKPFLSLLVNNKKWLLRPPYDSNETLYELYSFTCNIKELKKKNEVSVNWLDGLQHIDYCYKYMSLNTAIKCLQQNTICFKQPSQWEDQYEKRFYDAEYHVQENRIMPKFYACCFTSKQDNEAAWNIYSHGSSGPGSKVVEFKLSFRKLYENLILNLEKCSIYIGLVKYYNKEIIDNLHKRTVSTKTYNITGDVNEIDNPYFYYYFKNFSINNLLNLLLLKREAFEHEQEIRFFIVPNDQELMRKNKIVNVDWIDLIEQVRIDKGCTDQEKESLKQELNRLYNNKKNLIKKGLKKYKNDYDKLNEFLSSSFVSNSLYYELGDKSILSFYIDLDRNIDAYFSNLHDRITPIEFDVYSSDSPEESNQYLIISF